jgi:glycosyltransferase involved in cell wall biosynthesis
MPVAALRAGGVGDTVQPGKTGLLVEPTEPPARFAEAILALIAEPARLRAMAEAARAYALSQSWDAIMGELRQRYQLAIDLQASASPEAAASSEPDPGAAP